MASAPLPGLFLPARPESPLDLERFEGAHAIDAFRLPATGREPWVVVRTRRGALYAVEPARQRELPEHVRAELHQQQVAGWLRTLEVERVFLFRLESAAQLSDVPGPNDPVQLSGRLYGPFPSEAPVECAGRFTVARGDLLDALVRAAPFAFHGIGPTAEQTPLHRHFELAGEAGLDVRGSFVVAWPLPAEGHEHEGNDRATAHLVAEELRALKADLVRADALHLAGTVELPVPSLLAAIVELESRGFRVAGDVASRPRRGLLGWAFQDEVKLPREADGEGFLRVAAELLAMVPDWPTARARALRTVMSPDDAAWSADAIPRGLNLVARSAKACEVRAGVLALRAGGSAAFVSDRPLRFRPGDVLHVRVEARGEGVLALSWDTGVPGVDLGRELVLQAGWATQELRLAGDALRPAMGGPWEVALEAPHGAEVRRIALHVDRAKTDVSWRLFGTFESVDASCVARGWVMDPSGSPARVRFLDGPEGALLGEVRADLPRSDVLEAHGFHVRCGFQAALPGQVDGRRVEWVHAEAIGADGGVLPLGRLPMPAKTLPAKKRRSGKRRR